MMTELNVLPRKEICSDGLLISYRAFYTLTWRDGRSGNFKGPADDMYKCRLAQTRGNHLYDTVCRADSLFYFLPLLLAITAARKFGANLFVSVTVAGALIYPTIIELKNGNAETDFSGFQSC